MPLLTTLPNRRLITGGLLAMTLGGMGAALLDLLWPLLAARPELFADETSARGATYLLGLGALGGFIAGIPVVGLLRVAVSLGRRRRFGYLNPGVLLATIAVAVLFIYQNQTTFDGGGIRQNSLRPLYMGLFFLLGVGGILIACRVLPALMMKAISPGGGRCVWLISPSALGLAAFLFWVDATQWKQTTYGHLHLQLAATVVVLIGVALLPLLWHIPPNMRFLMGIGAGVLISAAFFLRLGSPLAVERAGIATHSINVGQWMRIPESLLQLGARETRGPVTEVEHLFGEGSRDPAVTREVNRRLDRLLPGRRDLSVLVLSIDTVRNDRMGYMNYHRDLTPKIDALAERSLVFERAYCQYPTSSGSFSSLLTGRFVGCAPVFWEWRRRQQPFAPDFTLPGILKDRGLETVAECAFNRANLAQRDMFGHLRDGFEIFNPVPTEVERGAQDVADSVIGQLRRLGDQRFLLWAHFLDPHHPYDVIPEFPFGSRPQDRYDSEIALADRHAGRILDELERSGRMKNTVIVVLSDHGEEFNEHFGKYHCTSLYEEQVRVPLIIHVPGMKARRVKTVVGLVDVMPTLLELLDVPDPFARTGRSLWPLIMQEGAWSEFTFAELFPNHFMLAGGKDMVVQGPLKLVTSLGTGTEEIYDLRTDPDERDNLVSRLDPKAASRLRGLRDACRKRLKSLRRRALATTSVRDESAASLTLELDELQACPAGERLDRLHQLILRVVDPLFGLRTEYQVQLQGPLREKTRAVLLSLLDPDQPPLAASILRLANVLEDPGFLEAVTEMKAQDVGVITELLLLRAALGDATVLPLLRTSFALPGAPARGRLAVALFQLDDESAIDHALCAATTTNAMLIRRLLPPLARKHPDQLLNLAERMLTHQSWEGATVRIALVDALTNCPPKPRRNRLLARLASDYDRRVSKKAREALSTTVPKQQRASLLEAGAAEAEADQGIQGRHFAAALADMERTLAAMISPSANMVLKLSSLHQFHGDQARALTVLRRDGANTPQLALRRQHFEEPGPWMNAEFPFEITQQKLDPRGLPGAWNMIEARLRNTGTKLWQRGRVGLTVAFEVSFLDAQGRPAPGIPPWSTWIHHVDVPPTEQVTLLIPFLNPQAPGTYRMLIRMIKTLPDGSIRRGPEVRIRGVSYQVVPRLF